ncbi:MAG: hypothetical protein U0Y96_15505 [Candidatus Kapaibacterium sp.]|nr:hypothetical protein [Bacteroidota bacterium]
MKHSILFVLIAVTILASCGKDERPTRTAVPIERPHVQFTCKGTEPFWTMEVGDTTAAYSSPEHQQSYSVRNVFPVGDGYIVYFNDETTLTLTKEECTDDATGEKWTYKAVLANPVDTIKGCANKK